MNKKNGTTVGFIAAAIALLVAAMAVPAGAGDLTDCSPGTMRRIRPLYVPWPTGVLIRTLTASLTLRV